MIQTMLKESLVGGSKSATWGPYLLVDLDPRSKSAVKPVRHWLRSNEEIMRHHTLNERMLIITNSDQL